MHPRITELLGHLDSQRTYLRAAVDEIPADQLAVEPAPGRWSVLGVLEHLSIIETRITGLLQKKVSEAQLGPETESTPVMPDARMGRMRDRSIKITASDAVQPTGTVDMNAAWKALETSRTRLRAFIAEVDGLSLGDVTHPHPVFGPLDVYSWIAFIGSHEARHADQIREIGASLAGA